MPLSRLILFNLLTEYICGVIVPLYPPSPHLTTLFLCLTLSSISLTIPFIKTNKNIAQNLYFIKCVTCRGMQYHMCYHLLRFCPLFYCSPNCNISLVFQALQMFQTHPEHLHSLLWFHVTCYHFWNILTNMPLYVSPSSLMFHLLIPICSCIYAR